MARFKVADGGFEDARLRDVEGRYVRTLREMCNGNYKIPKGSIVRVSSHWQSGVSLESDRCKCCGVSVFISKVHRDDVELMPKDWKPVGPEEPPRG